MAVSEITKRLSMPVSDLDLELSVRVRYCLRNENITYVKDLVEKTEAEMLGIPNFGRKSLNEIKEVLDAMGLWFGYPNEDCRPNPSREPVHLALGPDISEALRDAAKRSRRSVGAEAEDRLRLSLDRDDLIEELSERLAVKLEEKRLKANAQSFAKMTGVGRFSNEFAIGDVGLATFKRSGS